jgi:protein TonB
LEAATDTSQFDVMVGYRAGFILSGAGAAVATFNPAGNAPGPGIAVDRPLPGVAPGLLPPPVHIGPDIAKANLLTPQNLPGGSQEVTLRLSIDKDGKVTNASVMSGNPRLTNVAIEVVQQWRYRPHLANGQPTPVETTVNVNFP